VSDSQISLLPNKIVATSLPDKLSDETEVETGSVVEEEVVDTVVSSFSADVQTVSILEDCEEGAVEQVVSTT